MKYSALHPQKQVTFKDPLTTDIQDRIHEVNPFALRNLNKTEIRALRVILGNPIFPYAISDEIEEETSSEYTRIEEITTTRTPTNIYNTAYYIDLEEKSTEAISKRKDSIQEFKDRLIEEDGNNGYYSRGIWLSVYEEAHIVNNWCGHTKPKRFWYNTSPHIVDATTKTKCYVESPRTTYQFDSQYYYLHKTQYKKVVIQLTPHAKTRQYGRVFFSTVTRYIPWDKPILPRRKLHKVEGYIIKGNYKIYLKRYINPLKNTLYTTNGTGILKKLTTKGIIAERVFWNLELYRARKDSWFSSQERNTEDRVPNILHYQIFNKTHLDIENWALNQERIVPYDDNHKSHFYRYYNEQRDIEDHITNTLKNAIKYRIYCRRIQRFWITRRYLPKLRAVIIISRAYRKYITNNIGKEHSIFPNDHDSDTD